MTESVDNISKTLHFYSSCCKRGFCRCDELHRNHFCKETGLYPKFNPPINILGKNHLCLTNALPKIFYFLKILELDCFEEIHELEEKCSAARAPKQLQQKAKSTLVMNAFNASLKSIPQIVLKRVVQDLRKSSAGYEISLCSLIITYASLSNVQCAFTISLILRNMSSKEHKSWTLDET